MSWGFWEDLCKINGKYQCECNKQEIALYLAKHLVFKLDPRKGKFATSGQFDAILELEDTFSVVCFGQLSFLHGDLSASEP